jgi:DNA-binding CsgD family transcriptional regulator
VARHPVSQSLARPGSEEPTYQARGADEHRWPRAVPDDFRPGSRAPEFVLDGDAGAVYMYALRSGGLTCARDAAEALDRDVEVVDGVIERLVGMHLLRQNVTGGFTALDPEVATASLISPMESEIHRHREMIAAIRAQLSDLQPQYHAARPPRAAESSIRPLGCDAETRGALFLAANQCSTEVVAIRSHAGEVEGHPDDTLARDMAALERGARLRVVYPHAARADFAAKAHMKRISALGAEVRTANHLPGDLTVFDGEVAFTIGAGTNLEVSDPALTQFLGQVFEWVWDTAQPYAVTESGYEGVADEILRDVARLLAEGLTDEVIARRLGMSLRACRRHIARLLSRLDSVSRFQAGTRAASIGILGARIPTQPVGS